MNQHASMDELNQTLAELETLHAREAQVLRGMRKDAIDAITDEKSALCDRLRELSARTPFDERHRPALERIRKQATLNQLLVVHARDAVRTILAHASGTPIEGMPGTRKPTVQDGLRLNVRG